MIYDTSGPVKLENAGLKKICHCPRIVFDDNNDELVKKVRKYLLCHSGLDPESSSFQ
jgi:hypothetical protein